MPPKLKPSFISPKAGVSIVNKIELYDFNQNFVYGTVVSRPSESIKSPYVADVISERYNSNSEYIRSNTEKISAVKMSSNRKSFYQSISKEIRNKKIDIYLAHTPALDCAGMINPGSTVYMTENKSASSKTKYAIQYVDEIRENNIYEKVGCHPNSAEKIALSIITKDILSGDVAPLMLKSHHNDKINKKSSKSSPTNSVNYTLDKDQIALQKTFGNSRFDYVVPSMDKNYLYLIEVKNVVGADYIENQVPSNRSENGVYTQNKNIRNAIFPHGSHKAGIPVVSDRAIKHVHELTELQGQVISHTFKTSSDITSSSTSKKATTSSSQESVTDTTDLVQNVCIQSIILFIINRSDCQSMRPCHEADVLFAQVLKRAYQKGVLILAYDTCLDYDRNNQLTGKVLFGKKVPVEFDDSINENLIDEELLQKVLEFNAENGSKRSNFNSPNKKSKIK